MLLDVLSIFFWFYSLHFLVYNNNEDRIVEYDYRGNLNMTKLYQIDPNWQNDTEHLSLLKMLQPFIKRDDFEPFLGPQRGG